MTSHFCSLPVPLFVAVSGPSSSLVRSEDLKLASFLISSKACFAVVAPPGFSP